MPQDSDNRSRLGTLGRRLFQDRTPDRSRGSSPFAPGTGPEMDEAVSQQLGEWDAPTAAHVLVPPHTPLPVGASPVPPPPRTPAPPPRVPPVPPVSAPPAPPRASLPAFVPAEPATLEEAGLEFTLVEQIVLRMLLNTGTSTGRQIARDTCLHQTLVNGLLDSLRQRTLLQHRGSTPTGDFLWTLTDAGREKAVDYRKLCLYVGPAPVPLEQYLDGVRLQAMTDLTPSAADLRRAFQDLIVNPGVEAQIGPALTSGRGLFLYGHPGNGKTSIAERITQAFGGTIWIPQTLVIDGILVNLFDPATHVLAESRGELPVRVDRRWVKVRRPTVLAGGELTLEMLDVKFNPVTGVCEAPLQLKANCGSLVVDDFGRQLVEPSRLLNRWIVPLERRVDFLRLPNARKLKMPFEVLLIFSTNLQPRDLVDEAFLRRIPYKVYVPDPTETEFRTLLDRMAADASLLVPDPRVWDWLIETWYTRPQRPYRFCHPRDLVHQVVNICRYEQRPLTLDAELLDRGARMYFAL